MGKAKPADTPATTNEPKPADNPATGTEPQAAPATNDPTTPANPAEKSYSQSEFDAALKREKKEWDKTAQKQADAAKLSEDERIKAENDDLKRELRMNKAESSVLKELEKAGAKSPKLLFGVKKGELQFDDKGNLSNLSDVIDDLKLEFPDQFEVEKPNEPIGAAEGTTGNKPALTKALIEKMTPAEYLEREAEVDAFLKTLK